MTTLSHDYSGGLPGVFAFGVVNSHFDFAIHAVHLPWYHNGVNTRVFQEMAGNQDFAYRCAKFHAEVHAPGWWVGYDDADVAKTPKLVRAETWGSSNIFL